MPEFTPLTSNDIDETTVDALVRAWDGQPGPTLEDFLADREPVSLPTLVELARVDQEARRRRGEPVPVETYLERYPAIRTGKTT